MTRSDKYLWDVCLEIYQRMYAEASPSLDFRKALDEGVITSKPDWFSNYYLDMERQKEIFDIVVKSHHCSRYEKKKIANEIWLGASPTSVRKK